MKNRTQIPRELKNLVLYKAAMTCCVCRARDGSVEIHHIDKNPSNNVEGNLVAICRNCHGLAHSKHELTQNLTDARLSEFKQNWEREVAAKASNAILGNGSSTDVMWTYISHQRLSEFMRLRGVDFDKNLLQRAMKLGITDGDGIPVFNRAATHTGELATIYDRFEWDQSARLHRLYVDAVNSLVSKCPPIELGAIWSRGKIKDLAKPGSLCICIRGFRFQRGTIQGGEEDRTIYTCARGIELRLTANTRHMFGSSALYSTFTGHSYVAVLMLVKNVSNEDGRLVIEATPLAMGAVASDYASPHDLNFGRKNRNPIKSANKSKDIRI